MKSKNPPTGSRHPSAVSPVPSATGPARLEFDLRQEPKTENCSRRRPTSRSTSRSQYLNAIGVHRRSGREVVVRLPRLGRRKSLPIDRGCSLPVCRRSCVLHVRGQDNTNKERPTPATIERRARSVSPTRVVPGSTAFAALAGRPDHPAHDRRLRDDRRRHPRTSHACRVTAEDRATRSRKVRSRPVVISVPPTRRATRIEYDLQPG